MENDDASQSNNMTTQEQRANAMETMVKYTLQDIQDDYTLSEKEIAKEWMNVMLHDCSTNKTTFAGNKLLYHYMLTNLAKTTRKGKKSFADTLTNADAYAKLWEQTKKRGRAGSVQKRLFQAHQINTGSIAFFKASNAMYMYQKYKATKVLDPTAGWGGRAIAAVALGGIDYVGIDTNISLKPAYEKMFAKTQKVKMLWQNCLEVDFEEIECDFVLTSPPYIDLEMYEHMEAFGSKENYYKNFLIPLLDKCRKHCSGAVAFNLAPDMYKDLTGKFGYETCDVTEDLKEHKQGKTPDNIYVWKKEREYEYEAYSKHEYTKVDMEDPHTNESWRVYMVAGGGMANGNAYAEVKHYYDKDLVIYVEYGQNAWSNEYPNHTLEWDEGERCFDVVPM